MGPKQDESIPSVPGLEVTGPNVLECGARPTGDCAGSNDFRCAFDALARATNATLTAAIECGGVFVVWWFEVQIGKCSKVVAQQLELRLALDPRENTRASAGAVVGDG